MSQTSATPAGSSPALGLSRVVRLVRVVAIIGVLVAEFVLLLGIVHLDDPVEQRRVALAAATTQVDEALRGVRQGVDPSTYDVPVERVVAALVATRAPGSASLPAIESGTQEGLRELASGLDDTSRMVEKQGSRTDLRVVAWLLTLFTAVCIGWFTWFARLARRHRAAQEKLTAAEVHARGERRLHALIDNSSEMVAVLLGDSTVTFVTPATDRVLGVRDDRVTGRRFLELVVEGDRPLLARLLAHPDGAEHEVTLRVPHADGRVRVLEGTVKDLHEDPTVEGWVLTLRDVTERRRLEESLTHQAFHDSLTGLANRQLFLDRLEQGLRRRRAGEGDLTVLFVDLDDFKEVNDSLGHHVGDRLLVAAAQRMQEVLRPQDTVARLGGDDFALLLDGTCLDGADRVAQRVLDALAAPLVVAEQRHVMAASIGLAGADCPDIDAHDLMRHADVAMYDAKARGKGCVARYDESLHTRALEVLALRSELVDAIDGNELVLHYQPSVALNGQSVSGFEALVRWQHPTRGLVMPGDFIPIAEESGLVVPLGAWVLRRACFDAVQLFADADHRMTIAVNVAAQQLNHPDFHTMVVGALADSTLPADRLVLEVTETVLLSDVAASALTLSRLRDLGVRVAIDDFGTGYNSLTNLSVLPVDVLKLDRSFVMRLGGPEDTSSLVEAILAMSAALDLDTVAEGVELAHQADWLREHGARSGQGFLWSRGVDLDRACVLARDGVPIALPARPRGVVRPAPEASLSSRSAG